MSGTLLKVSDVAALTQLNRKTICQEIAEGRLPAYKFGNQYRIDPKNVDSWLESRLVSAHSVATPITSARDSQAETYAIGKVAS